jgi:hypothetical protein
MHNAFKLLKIIDDSISFKYGEKSKKYLLFRSNILDLNRRLLLWHRQEKGYDELVPFTWFMRLKSFIHFISCRTHILLIKRCDYLFFPTNETHLVQHMLVVLELIKKGKRVLVVTTKKRLVSKVPSGVPYFFLSAVFNPFLFRFRKVESQAAPFSLSFIGHSELRTSVLYFFFQRICAATSAKAIIVGNDLSLEAQVSASVVRAAGGKVYTIQHGAVSNPIHSFSKVDKFFAFGEHSKKALISHGMNPSSIVVSGAPYLTLRNHQFNSIVPLLHQLEYEKQEKAPKICLILLSGHGHSTSLHHQLKVFGALQTAANKIPDILFLFKLHTKDARANYRKLLSSPTSIHFLDNDGLGKFGVTVFDLMKEADCIVSGASASVLEAMYFSKPVFTMDLMAEYNAIDFIRAGVTRHLQTEEQVVEELRLFFSGKLDLTEYFRRASFYISEYYFEGILPAHELIAREILNDGTD